MNCPRCERESLHEKDRQGITIDVCEECRGIWLDRGELEKLIARAQRELDEVHADAGHADAGRAEGVRAREAVAGDRGGDRVGGRPSGVAGDRAGASANGPMDDRGPRDGRGRWDDDDDLDDDDRRNPRRKRGFLESLGDLFD